MRSKPLDWAFKAVDLLSATLAGIGSLGALALVVVTVVAVFFRYVIGDPIFGIGDISTMLLVVVVAGSIIYGAKIGAHVQVDVLNMVGGRRVTRYCDVVIRLLSAIIAFLLAIALWDEIQCGEDCGYFTPNLEIGHTPFHAILMISMAGYAVLQILELIEGLRHFGADEDPNERS